MNIVSAPHYFSFLTQIECPFFEEKWEQEIAELTKDLAWIEALEKENNEIYSGDPDSHDFPTFWNWPENWKEAHRRAVDFSDEKKKQHLRNAEKHDIDEVSIYILEDAEEVWLSTPHYGHGSIEKVDAVDKYDSAITAAYIYINEHNEWSKKHKSTWDVANILSSADPRPPTDWVICEICGTSFDLAQDVEQEICQDCKNH